MNAFHDGRRSEFPAGGGRAHVPAVRDVPLDAMSERFMMRACCPESATTSAAPRPARRCVLKRLVGEKFSPRIKMKVLRREADGSSTSYLLRSSSRARFWCASPSA